MSGDSAPPASKFMRGLCYHYGVELHNFAPNSISHAATFVGICEGFLGVPVSWDLWLHLFRGELFTAGGGKGKRRPIHVGGLTFALRSRRFIVYPPCNMTTNTSKWDKVCFYLRNDGAGSPPTPARSWTGVRTTGRSGCPTRCDERSSLPT
jgi:hypothetical protein